jgi:hypothetical protein
VKAKQEQDRRYQTRPLQTPEILVRLLPQLGSGNATKFSSMPGRVHKIGEGSVCIVTSCPLERFALVRCEIPVGDVSMNVPTLMQVRWSKKQKLQTESYLSELSFLL